MPINENIKKIRKANKLTQKQFAGMIGKKEITVRRYEKGDIIPPMSVINDISEKFDVPVSEIIDDSHATLAQQTINKLVRSIVGDEIYTEVKIDQEERLNEFIDYIKTLIQHDIDIEADIDALSYDDKKILFNAFIDNMKLNIKAILYDNKNK
ncbi:helix-turn-helix domain-containing protein [Faecalibacillus faecis]|uniref:helix-turn-helix domain-containing protein n=1 Tax=Faecalibacillus faecis TaxID=1982628 RepID=UPI00386DC804